jgi:hypothetical protein
VACPWRRDRPAHDHAQRSAEWRAFQVRSAGVQGLRSVEGHTADTRVVVGLRTIKRITSNDFTITVPLRDGTRVSVVASNDAGTAHPHATSLPCRPVSQPPFTG